VSFFIFGVNFDLANFVRHRIWRWKGIGTGHMRHAGKFIALLLLFSLTAEFRGQNTSKFLRKIRSSK